MTEVAKYVRGVPRGASDTASLNVANAVSAVITDFDLSASPEDRPLHPIEHPDDIPDEPDPFDDGDGLFDPDEPAF